MPPHTSGAIDEAINQIKKIRGCRRKARDEAPFVEVEAQFLTSAFQVFSMSATTLAGIGT